MPKAYASLEKAILDKAQKDPEFMEKLLQDPFGFLKGLAVGEPGPGLSPWGTVEAGANGKRTAPRYLKLIH